MVTRRLAPLALAAILAAAPWFVGRDVTTALLLTFVLVVVACNYDVLGGSLGMHNLGQATFFGVGAYVTFLVLLRVGPLSAMGAAGTALAVMAGGLAGGVFAWGVSGGLVRLRSAYFSVGSFAMLLTVRLAVDNAVDWTGGVQGLYVPSERYLPLGVAYAATLALAAASIALNARLAASALGLAMVAVRESEPAAAAAGIDALRVKRIALVVGAVPTALAGSVFGLYAGYIDSNVVLGVERSLFPVIAAMIGGSGLVWGPVAGAALLRVIDYVLKFTLRLPIPSVVVYGLILMAASLLVPRGLLALLNRPAGRRRAAPVDAPVSADSGRTAR